MSRSRAGIQAVVVLTGMFFVAQANAGGCYSKSPNFTGDDYFEVANSKTLSSQDEKLLGQLFDFITGEWEGKGIGVTCKGSSKNAREERAGTEIESSISTHQKGALEVRSNVTQVEEGTSRSHVIKLSYDAENMRFDLVGNTLTVSERYRRRNSNGSSRFVENIYEISGQGKSLGVLVTMYVNGFLVSEDQWALGKTR